MGWFRRRSRAGEAAGDIETTIGRSTTLSGELKVDGGLRIDGRFEGSLEVGGNVVVGERGRVVADIDAGHVTIAGAVQGNIRATGRLEILSTGVVQGDILANQVMIDPGGVLQGMSLMGEAAAPALAAPSEPLRELDFEDAPVIEVEPIESSDKVIEGRAARVVSEPESEATVEPKPAPEPKADSPSESAAEPELAGEPTGEPTEAVAKEPATDATVAPEADAGVTAFAKPSPQDPDAGAQPAAERPRSSRRGGLGKGLELDPGELDIEPVIPDLSPPSSAPPAEDEASPQQGQAPKNGRQPRRRNRRGRRSR